MTDTTGNIIGFARLTSFHEKGESTNEVSNIGEVPFRIKVADVQDGRRGVASFQSSQLVSEPGHGGLFILSRSQVVEQPGTDNGQSIFYPAS